MGVNWDEYSKEKKEIKLKYLELLKKHCITREMNLREEVTKWALSEFPCLKVPKKQFGGSFDHKTLGFFFKDHNFVVTKKSIKQEAAKRGISEPEYINELISIVKNDSRK